MKSLRQWWDIWVEAGYTPIGYRGQYPVWPDVDEKAPSVVPGGLNGIGLRCGPKFGLIVLDSESRDLGDIWLRRHPTPMVVHTPRGTHAYYRYDPRSHQGSLLGLGSYAGTPYPVDLLSGSRENRGRVARCPPTTRGDRQYTLLSARVYRLAELPLWDRRWLPSSWQARPTPPRPTFTFNGPPTAAADSAAAYIGKIRAVEGQRGSARTFRAACKLVDSGLSYDVCWSLLVQWNSTNAEPPWSEYELRQKLECAFSRHSS